MPCAKDQKDYLKHLSTLSESERAAMSYQEKCFLLQKACFVNLKSAFVREAGVEGSWTLEGEAGSKSGEQSTLTSMKDGIEVQKVCAKLTALLKEVPLLLQQL